jgi:hypothetical protein
MIRVPSRETVRGDVGDFTPDNADFCKSRLDTAYQSNFIDGAIVFGTVGVLVGAFAMHLYMKR